MNKEVADAGTSAEEEALQSRDSGDCDICLTGREGSLREVYKDLLKSPSLRAVYSDGPAEHKGVLLVFVSGLF